MEIINWRAARNVARRQGRIITHTYKVSATVNVIKIRHNGFGFRLPLNKSVLYWEAEVVFINLTRGIS